MIRFTKETHPQDGPLGGVTHTLLLEGKPLGLRLVVMHAKEDNRRWRAQLIVRENSVVWCSESQGIVYGNISTALDKGREDALKWLTTVTTELREDYGLDIHWQAYTRPSPQTGLVDTLWIADNVMWGGTVHTLMVRRMSPRGPNMAVHPQDKWIVLIDGVVQTTEQPVKLHGIDKPTSLIRYHTHEHSAMRAAAIAAGDAARSHAAATRATARAAATRATARAAATRAASAPPDGISTHRGAGAPDGSAVSLHAEDSVTPEQLRQGNEAIAYIYNWLREQEALVSPVGTASKTENAYNIADAAEQIARHIAGVDHKGISSPEELAALMGWPLATTLDALDFMRRSITDRPRETK
jgi:hypothetical protein